MPYMEQGTGVVPTIELGNNNGNGMFGNNTGDWAWIIILFLIFGLGGNGRGFGNFGGGSSGIADNYVLATDFATIERKLDSLANGICDSTFALNNTITNGNFGLQNSLTQGFSGINQAINTSGYETRLGLNTLAAQLANCLNGFFKAVKNRLQKVNTVGSIA